MATGGGGLIGGIAAWYAGSGVAVVSVEPEGCPTLATALREGRPVPAPVGGMAADSLGARQVGALMFAVAREHVAQAVLVPDDAIRAAQRLLWEACRLVAEPGGATALAALISGAWAPPTGRAGGRAGLRRQLRPGQRGRLTPSVSAAPGTPASRCPARCGTSRRA